jgi:ABC-type uncharacterized transport system permease subunit
MIHRHAAKRIDRRRARRGASAVDYALLLGVVLPMAAFILWVGPKMIRWVYEMVVALISWPFM